MSIIVEEPVWSPEPPQLSRLDALTNGRTSRREVMLSWQLPSYPLPSSHLQIKYILCTMHGCSEPVVTRPNQTLAYIPLHHEKLANYTGLAWVRLEALSLIGPSSTSPSSLPVNIGRGTPSLGYVTLSQTVESVDGRRRLSSISDLTSSELIIQGFVEPILGIETYRVCLGSKPGRADVLPCQLICSQFVTQSAGDGEACDSVGLPTTGVLPLGQYSALLQDEAAILANSVNGTARIYATVKACTFVGDCQVAISPAVTIDTLDPVIGFIADGLIIQAVDNLASWEDVWHVECGIRVSDEEDNDNGDAGSSTGCTTKLLLGSDRTMNRMITRQLSSLALAAPNRELVRTLSGQNVGVTWGSIVDSGSGVEHAELCVASHCVTLMPSSGAMMPSSGMAIFTLPELASGDFVSSTICATDYATNRACHSSIGTTVVTSNAAVSNISSLTQYMSSCEVVSMSWVPPADNAQCDNLTLSMKICSGATRGCLPSRTLSRGSSNLSATLLEPLAAGVEYTAHVTTSGCNQQSSAPTISRSFICDQTPPLTSNELSVSLRSANPLAQPGHTEIGHPLLVSWQGVFNDPESGVLMDAELCLGPVPLKCKADQWVPISAGVSRLYEINPTTISELGLLGNISAKIRVRNRAGHRATSQSELLELHLSNSTKLDSFEVDEYLALTDDSLPVSNGPCILNRTHSIRVGWSASVLFQSILVTVHNSTDVVARASLNGSTDDVMFATLPGLATSGHARFSVLATFLHGGQEEYRMECLIDVEPPVAGSLHLTGAFRSLPGSAGAGNSGEGPGILYVVRPQDTPLTICWDDFEGDGLSGIREYLVMICRPVTAGDCADETQLLQLARVEAPRCFNASLLLSTSELSESTTFDVRVAAVSGAGLRGPTVVTTFVTDLTPPIPPADSAVVLHTTGLSEAHVSMPCCLVMSWKPWTDSESALDSYELCFANASDTADASDATNASDISNSLICANVGNATSAAVQSTAEVCELHPCPVGTAYPTLSPESASSLKLVRLNLPVVDHTLIGDALPSIHFVLRGINILGDREELEEQEVVVLGEPIALEAVTFGDGVNCCVR